MKRKNYLTRWLCAMMLLLSTVPTKAAYTWWEDLWFYYCWLNTPSLDTPIFSSVYMVNFDLNEGDILVRDFIPASYQNEPGLYDRLTQTFGGSISGVSFQGSMSTAIKNQPTAENTPATIWYGTDGRRLTGKPTQKGVYINDGKKLVVK